MPTNLRNLLLAAAIAMTAVPVVGQVAQAQSFEIGGGGFSVGFGDDDGFEIGTDFSSDWDDEDAGIELEFDIEEDDEEDDDE
jgi:hypothetical protein